MAQPETFSYGLHELQKIHVWKAENSPQDKDLLWVMYVPNLSSQAVLTPFHTQKLTFVIDTFMAGHGETTPSSPTPS